MCALNILSPQLLRQPKSFACLNLQRFSIKFCRSTDQNPLYVRLFSLSSYVMCICIPEEKGAPTISLL